MCPGTGVELSDETINLLTVNHFIQVSITWTVYAENDEVAKSLEAELAASYSPGKNIKQRVIDLY